MRRLVLSLLLVFLVLPGYAAKRVTVEQLNQVLATMDRKSDADVAAQISDMELSERLSAAQFIQLNDRLPGDQSRQALLGLADQSAFLNPPASEIPNKPEPSVAEQRRIMELVVNYVSKVNPQLPNFLATRTTLHFEDTPLLQRSLGTTVPYRPLHMARKDVATVSYSEGHEIVERVSAEKMNPLTQGLQTEGIFGPFLGRVLVDAAQSSLKWDRWEADAQDEAVFVFDVPKDKSHYEVDYCCMTYQTATREANALPFRAVVPYRGEMTVDSANGTILRLVVKADIEGNGPITKSAILVEYGQVEIGGRSYVCPTKSVSLLTGQTFQLDPTYHNPVANAMQPLQTVMDDARFDKYHIFRTESRILTAENRAASQTGSNAEAAPAKAGEGMEPAAAPAPSGSSQAGNQTAQAAMVTQDATKESATPVSGVTTANVTMGAEATTEVAAGRPPEAAVTPAAPAEAPTPEVSVAAATSLPTGPAVPADSGSQAQFTLRTTSRLVDVGVVAFDKNGHPVTDLKPMDFEVYDNGVKQDVRSFSRAGETALTGPEQAADEKQSAASEPVFSNRTPSAENAKTAAVKTESNTTVLLMDANSLSFSDLTHVREAALRFLKTLPAGERVGIYELGGAGFKVLLESTADSAALQAKLKNWMPSAQDLANAQTDEARNRHQMGYVDNLRDLLSVNGNSPQGRSAAAQPQDLKLHALGDDPARASLVILPSIARHLATIAGHKSLIWVSSDNVLADWSDSAPNVERGDKYLDPFLLQAQEALNEAHVSIYPLDASQLEVGGVGADAFNANVQVNPAAPDPRVQFAELPGSEQQDAAEALAKSQRNMYGGRIKDQMKQDMHPISAEYRTLAEATGGRALRRAGDIAGELNGIVNDGRASYLLSFAPSLPADDKYHLITVKVQDRHGIMLRYRAGYLASKEPESLKERFRQAIWEPRDSKGIGLQAMPGSDAEGRLIHLNIAGTDLELAQRGRRWMDKLDIFLVERDLAGQHVKVSGQTLGLRLLPGTYQKVLANGVDFEQRVEAQPGAGDLRVVVVDENSGRLGSVTIPAASLVQVAVVGKRP